MTQNRSYDFIFSKIEDSFDFIIAISEAMLRLQTSLLDRKVIELKNSFRDLPNPRKSDKKAVKEGIEKERIQISSVTRPLRIKVNRQLIRFQMMRLKLEYIANDKGYTLGQYLMIAIYNTIVDWPGEQDCKLKEIQKKVEAFKHIVKIISDSPKLQVIQESLDMSCQKQTLMIYNAKVLNNLDNKMSFRSTNTAIS